MPVFKIYIYIFAVFFSSIRYWIQSLILTAILHLWPVGVLDTVVLQITGEGIKQAAP